MTNPFSLDGRTALVTGANRGLGRAFAEALADAGADVVVVGRHEDRNRAGSHRDRGADRAPYDGRDRRRLRAPTTYTASWTRRCRAHGRIDVLVNNAGICFHRPALEVPDEEFDDGLRRQRDRAVADVEGRRAAHDRGRRRLDRQRRLDLRDDREPSAVAAGVQRLQGRRAPAHQVARGGTVLVTCTVRCDEETDVQEAARPDRAHHRGRPRHRRRDRPAAARRRGEPGARRPRPGRRWRSWPASSGPTSYLSPATCASSTTCRRPSTPPSSGSAASTWWWPTPASPATARCSRSTRPPSSGSSTSTSSVSSTPCARPARRHRAPGLRAGRLLAGRLRRVAGPGGVQRQQGRRRALRQRAAARAQAPRRRRRRRPHVVDRHPAGAGRQGGPDGLRPDDRRRSPTRSTAPPRSSPARRPSSTGIARPQAARLRARLGRRRSRRRRNLVNSPLGERETLKHMPELLPLMDEEVRRLGRSTSARNVALATELRSGYFWAAAPARRGPGPRRRPWRSPRGRRP